MSNWRRRAPRFGGRAGSAAIAAVITAQVSLLPLPLRSLQPGANIAVLGSIGMLVVLIHQHQTQRVQQIKAALFGVLLVSLRLSLFGPSIPANVTDRYLVPTGKIQASVTAVLAPLRGSQRFIADLGGNHIQVEAPPNPNVRVGDTIFANFEQRSVTAETSEKLRIRGISASTRTRSIRIVTRGSLLEAIRSGLGDNIERVLPAPAGGLAAAIVIGLRERVDERLASDFTATGLGHVVALSGWNVAITMAVADRLARRLSARGRRPLLVAVAIGYGIFAGSSASVIRASFMAAAAQIGAASGRPGSGAVALAHAALALMVLDPAIAADPGFRLSALATAGLLAKSQQWSARAARAGQNLPTTLRRGWLLIGEDVAVSLAAQAATLGLVIALFGRIAVWSIPLTLLIAPLIAPATAAALIAIVAGVLAQVLPPPIAWLATILAAPAAALFSTAAWIAQFGANLPAGGIEIPRSFTLLLGILIGVAGIWLLARTEPNLPDEPSFQQPSPSRSATTRLAIGVATLMTITSLTSLGNTAPTGILRITALDVGQGDAILIEVSGRRMLIDGGPDPNRLSAELDRIVPSWDRRIDVLVASHPHEDHLAGLPKLMDRYRVTTVIGSEERGGGPASTSWRETLQQHQASYHQVFTGDAFSVGLARFSVIWPDKSYLSMPPTNDGRALNDRSVVLRLDIPGFSAIFTGDIESDIDQRVLRNVSQGVDLLKAPHHGSKTSAGRELLEKLSARIAIVSVGAKNSYGHPSPDTLRRLGERGALVERTDLDGTVMVSIDVRHPEQILVRDARGQRRAPERLSIGHRQPSVIASNASLPSRMVSVGLSLGVAGCPIPRARIRPWELHRSS
ncbi:MAG: ComEC/Rec2 family competence protein [Chloroflexi bacterium]|nr:ComEC/Rec2 family competence protein [Chloroflexota bacterium]